MLGSGPAVQGIVLGAGDRLFYEVKVKVKQFLGSRAIDERGSAINRYHGNLCGQKGAGGLAACSAMVIALAPADGILASSNLKLMPLPHPRQLCKGRVA